MIQELQRRQKQINLLNYINPKILNNICDELNLPRPISKDSKEEPEMEANLEDLVEYSYAMKKCLEEEGKSDLDKH